MTDGALLRPWRWTSVWAIGLVCASRFVAVQAAEPVPDGYVKRASWAETMLATRAAVVQQLASQQAELSDWSTTGPLQAGAFTDVLFPEQGVDLHARSPDGRPLWRPHPEWTDGQVHMLDGSHRVSTYLFRTVKVPAAAAVEASLGSDDGCELWLNGRKVHSHDTPRGPAPDQDRVNLALQPGENRLLFKIHNNGGGHGFYFRLGQLSYATVWNQLEADYPLQTGWVRRHLPGGRHLEWLSAAAPADLPQQMIQQALRDLGGDARLVQGEFEQLTGAKVPADDLRWLELYQRVCLFRYRPAEVKAVNLAALRRAIEDLGSTFGPQYPRAAEFVKRLDELEHRVSASSSLKVGVAMTERHWALAAGDILNRWLAPRSQPAFLALKTH